MANIFMMNEEIARGMVCFFQQKKHFYLIIDYISAKVHTVCRYVHMYLEVLLPLLMYSYVCIANAHMCRYKGKNCQLIKNTF
jgi:hypothetical protein